MDNLVSVEPYVPLTTTTYLYSVGAVGIVAEPCAIAKFNSHVLIIPRWTALELHQDLSA